MAVTKRRSYKIIKNYMWLIALADDLRIIEELEFSLLKNKIELERWQVGDLKKVIICDGSLSARLEEKIDTLERLLYSRYEDCRKFVDYLYEFDSNDYRILYEFLTTTDSHSDIAKKLNVTTDYVKEVLTNINYVMEGSFAYDDDFTRNHSKLREMEIIDYTKLKVQELVSEKEKNTLSLS